MATLIVQMRFPKVPSLFRSSLILGLSAAIFRAQSASPTLTLQTNPDRSAQLLWLKSEAGYSLEQTGSLTDPVLWRPVSDATAEDGDRFSVQVQPPDQTQFFRLRSTVVRPLTIMSRSPDLGETGVSVSRETIFRLSSPLAS